jgi:molybdenum cofactor cytidylyltransferase
MSRVAAVVLAAGAATRMGKLKQLLPFRGRTLVQHAVAQVLEAGFDPVLVVVGAGAHQIREAVSAEQVVVLENENWNTGMGSSLSSAISHLEREKFDCTAVAITLADQPFVTGGHLQAMHEQLHRTGAEVVAAEYNNTLGVPAIFTRALFPLLAALPRDAGARQLVRKPGLDVRPFPLPEAAVDVDTPEDFANLEAF